MLATMTTEADTDPAVGTVLALHGIMASAETLTSLAAAWAGYGWRTVAVDLPGHGASPMPSTTGRHGDLIVDAVLEVAETIPGILVVYGHSAGGSVAAGVAAALGSRVSGVILEDPYWLLPVSHVHDPAVAEQQVAWLAEAQRQSEADRIAAHRALWPGWNELEFGPWSRAIAAVDPELVRAGDYIPTRGWPDQLRDLRTAGVPVLVVTGTDRTGVLEAHQTLASDLGAEVVVLEGASHFVHLDQPTRFVEVTANALRKMTLPS